MPIVVTDLTWQQTADEVHVSVPLKGVRAAKADIFSSDLYLKVNFPPYLFEADLLHAIDEPNSSATVTNGAVVFRLRKAERVEWASLTVKDLSKAELQQRRVQAQDSKRAQLQQDELDWKTREQDANRLAVQKQMEAEEKERRHRDEQRMQEMNAALAGIEELGNSNPAAVATATAGDKENKASRMLKQKGATAATSAAVRPSGKIAIKFTPRAFATPSRESHQAQEDEWLVKQSAARQAVQAAKESAPGSVDHDPVWLCDKGKTFLKQGNFQSAINAFTAAVALDQNMASAYSNRAICHMRLNDAYACAQDSTKALLLLQPACDSNAKARLVALCRRGAALALLGDFESALMDYSSALELAPDNQELINDIAALRLKAPSDYRMPASTAAH